MKEETNQDLAGYLDLCVRASGKTPEQVAHEIGYPDGKVVQMFVTGKTKIPFNKAARLATAVGVDPGDFLRLLMQHYTPQLLAVLDELPRTTSLTQDEHRLILSVREHTKGDRAFPMVVDARDVVAMIVA